MDEQINGEPACGAADDEHAVVIAGGGGSDGGKAAVDAESGRQIDRLAECWELCGELEEATV